MYGYDYDYEKYQKKSSDVNIQNIKRVNSNINVNGIEITQIPSGPDDMTVAAAAAADDTTRATNTHNDNRPLEIE